MKYIFSSHSEHDKSTGNDDAKEKSTLKIQNQIQRAEMNGNKIPPRDIQAAQMVDEIEKIHKKSGFKLEAKINFKNRVQRVQKKQQLY